MVIVTATVEVAADRIDEALVMSVEHVRRSRDEPGCLFHSVSRDAEDPNRLLFLENWADRAALQAHFVVPDAVGFAKALGAMASSRPDMRVYEAETFTPGR
ncbi:MAG TPA: putative quinol monooxygenase [Candidatus Dormibacteraeota bacterium]|nr:putative quinol monooxygenase [Candidatus Dormibacteraeota bacterium]